MRAAMVTRFGGPDVFQVVERPDPAPGPGQVLIEVEVADTLWLEAGAAGRRGITVTGIEAVQLSPGQLKRYTDRAVAEAAAGRITPVIGQVFALDQAGSAHAAIEGRAIFGKTLLRTVPARAGR